MYRAPYHRVPKQYCLMKELNHIKLQKALASLPQYEPTHDLWGQIEVDLQLGEMVQTLPEYAPPAMVWEDIDEKLGIAQVEEPLMTALEQLPIYEPPSLVWKGIEAQLAPAKEAKVVTLAWRGWIAAAAMVGVMLLAGVLFFNQDSETITIAYSEEVRNAEELKPDWYEDEDAFATILAICKTQTFTCEAPEFKSLKTELEELNDARTALEEVMGDYGQDNNLMKQLARIEHERSDVLKEMVKMI